MPQPSILIVDDELLIRDLLYDFFTGQGWDTAIADSGEKALEILQRRSVDLVLADIRMPGIDGLELTAELRELRPGLPVVLMTGYPSVDTAVAALRHRVADYVTKPFNINNLYKIVEAQVAAKEAAAKSE
ncbi:MAG TPA: response regulator [candidate division Zixibacteria bacterium]|nr:response regulator [candidate division Zixibacteria bacterium]MDD4917129.1 response regulator [candidate division Zixibacteria bacterium]MDM7972687.1 response regulator [candidate division Zixibacteria bacterium]HOD65397.1 response regulator [candidate division Zixibacteria bacterium]HOZ08528.1 response regulator [candidate division Zixibacteria bacterium]